MAASGHQQLDTSGFPTPPWLHLVGQLPKVTSRKVKLALPCIGLDALGWGLQEAGWESYEVTYAYDIDESHTQHSDNCMGSKSLHSTSGLTVICLRWMSGLGAE